MNTLLDELSRPKIGMNIVLQIVSQCEAQTGLLEHYGNEYYLAKAIIELSDRIKKLEANHG